MASGVLLRVPSMWMFSRGRLDQSFGSLTVKLFDATSTRSEDLGCIFTHHDDHDKKMNDNRYYQLQQERRTDRTAARLLLQLLQHPNAFEP